LAKKAKVYTGTEWVDLAAATVDLSTLLPAGMVAPFAGSAAPEGYLLCDGSAISRTGYARLFTAISTAYGTGDGSTTFNIPDLRGRVVAALDNMGGTDAGRLSLANTLGTTAGTQTHTLTTAEMPVHTHVQDAHGHSFTPKYGGYTAVGLNMDVGGWGNAYGLGGGYVEANTATNQNAGSGGAHNNMQPTILMNYIIKV
jgi:microcystin-dependent protein